MRGIAILAMVVVAVVFALAWWAWARAAARRRVRAENGARWEVDAQQAGDDTCDETMIVLRLIARQGSRRWQIGTTSGQEVITEPLGSPDYAGKLAQALARASQEAGERNARRALRTRSPGNL